MKNDDLISRASAIECAIDAIDDWDGGWNPNRETVIRKYFEELPSADAIPVEWLRRQYHKYMQNNDKLMCDAYAVVIGEWHDQQKEKEAMA